MNPPVFYAPPESKRNDLIELPRAESRHATKVLRLESGDLVVIIDGLGKAYKGEITGSVGRDKVLVRVFSELRNFGEPVVRLTLAAGLSTASQFDTSVPKGTELGVTRFVPIISELSKIKFDDPKRATAKVKRLEKVALAAIKQCRRACCPRITAPMSLDQFLMETSNDIDTVNLVFHPSENSSYLEKELADSSPRRVNMLIGPESGLSSAEQAMAIEAGYRMISLGSRILRTETAGPVVCALVMSLLNELK